MKKTSLLISFFFLLLATELHAQRYGTAAGFRGGRGGIGFTVQQRIFPKTTVEGMLVFDLDQIAFTSLYEFHRPLVFFKSFNYYIGGGMHIGHLQNNGVFGGFDGLFGVEYKLPIFPMLLSIDAKPAFHLNHPKSVEFQAGFSMRYVIVTHKQLRKRKKRKERAKRKEEKEKRKAERQEENKDKNIFERIFKKGESKDKKDDKKKDKKKSDKDKEEKKNIFDNIFKKKEKKSVD